MAGIKSMITGPDTKQAKRQADIATRNAQRANEEAQEIQAKGERGIRARTRGRALLRFNDTLGTSGAPA